MNNCSPSLPQLLLFVEEKRESAASKKKNDLRRDRDCGGRTRTSDLRVMSPASYQLLHSAMYMLMTGLEPVRISPADFKSAASADSATRASTTFCIFTDAGSFVKPVSPQHENFLFVCSRSTFLPLPCRFLLNRSSSPHLLFIRGRRRQPPPPTKNSTPQFSFCANSFSQASNSPTR